MAGTFSLGGYLADSNGIPSSGRLISLLLALCAVGGTGYVLWGEGEGKQFPSGTTLITSMIFGAAGGKALQRFSERNVPSPVYMPPTPAPVSAPPQIVETRVVEKAVPKLQSEIARLQQRGQL